MNLKNYMNKIKIIKSIYFLIILITLYLLANNYTIKELVVGFSRIGNLFNRMYPFDFSIFNSIVIAIFETINIAIFSSILGMITAILILPFVTVTLFEFKLIPKILSSILSIFRTIPFLIIASILVSLFSTGIFSGFISLYIINFLTAIKMLKEYAEEVSEKYLESLSSIGINKFLIYKKVILSNIKPYIISIFFIILESSIRGASILGLVGAGGIGQKIWEELNHLRYDRVSLIILILVILIFIIDNISFYIRTRKDFLVNNKNQYFIKKYVENIGIILAISFSFYYIMNFLNISLDRFLLGFTQLNSLVYGLVNPDWSYLGKMFVELNTSILIAITSTFLAAITSVITSYLASLNLFNKIGGLFFKLVINVLRTFPPVIVALIFFRGFGPGNISCFFALYFYTVGVISKMYSEILEGINENIIYSIESLGLKNLSAYLLIFFKEYYPEFISIFLYRLEMNVKNSTILGMVGAGGIGHLIVNNIEFRNWNRISVLLIGLCTVIIFIEYLSYYIRLWIKK